MSKPRIKPKKKTYRIVIESTQDEWVQALYDMTKYGTLFWKFKTEEDEKIEIQVEIELEIPKEVIYD
jgi:hypothetical protein